MGLTCAGNYILQISLGEFSDLHYHSCVSQYGLQGALQVVLIQLYMPVNSWVHYGTFCKSCAILLIFQ